MILIIAVLILSILLRRATDRAKVGLCKVLGVVRKQLVSQFMMESVLFATVASILSFGLVQILMPAYTNLLGYQLPSFWNDTRVYGFIIAVIIIVGLLAGSYPAFLLSSFTPIESLKGKLKTGLKGVFFRKALVVFQFGISVLLIVSVIVIMSQMNYLRNTDLSFNKEQSMIVRFDNLSISLRKQFKNELLSIPAINSVSLMSGELGGFHDGYSFESQAKPGEDVVQYRIHRS